MRPIRNTYALLLAVSIFMLIGAGLFKRLNNAMEEARAPMDLASSVAGARKANRFVAVLSESPLSVASPYDTLRICEAWIERRQWLEYSLLFLTKYRLSDTLKLVLRVETPHGSELHLDIRTADNRPLRTRVHEGVRLYYLDDLGTVVPSTISLRVIDRNLRKEIGTVELRTTRGGA